MTKEETKTPASPVVEEPAKSPKKKAKKAKSSTIVTRGKRKSAVARATIAKGKGRVFVNKAAIDSIMDKYYQQIILEPLRMFPDIATGVDVSVNVFGGGVMGQAQAARTAIARGILKYSNDDAKIKETFIEYDRFLLKEDVRRVEPKKYKGPKARARFQKSYR